MLTLQGALAWPLSGPRAPFFQKVSWPRGKVKCVCLALPLPEVVNVGKIIESGVRLLLLAVKWGSVVAELYFELSEVYFACLICLEREISFCFIRVCFSFSVIFLCTCV